MQRSCDVCGATYQAQRSTSRYCSSGCRVKATRGGMSKSRAPVAPIRTVVGGVVDATRAELVAVGRLESSAGQRALVLAALLDDPPPASYGSLAGWSKEHGAAMAEALKSAVPAVSSLDELKARRSAKRGA